MATPAVRGINAPHIANLGTRQVTDQATTAKQIAIDRGFHIPGAM
jgi:hypothetical protein